MYALNDYYSKFDFQCIKDASSDTDSETIFVWGTAVMNIWKCTVVLKANIVYFCQQREPLLQIHSR